MHEQKRIARSRRDVLRLLAVGGSCIGAGLVLPASAAMMRTGLPRYGGLLRVATATSSIADTLDPARLANQTDYARSRMLHSCLTSFDSHMNVVPSLASRFESRDARTWEFTLRKGVEFHNGKRLDGQDVVFSLLRHKDPATVSKAKAFADQIESVRVSSPGEVHVRLYQPNADLPVMLATFPFAIVPAGTTDFNAGIGTGPFVLKEFKRGLRSVMSRNPRYFRDGRPYLDEVILSGLGDEGARVNALLSGDLDLVAAVDPRSVVRIASSSSHTVFRQPSGQYSNLAIRKDQVPGSSEDFQLALKYLLNREQLVNSIALGNAIVANDQPIHPSNRFWYDALPQRHFDPDRAKFHFGRSGIGKQIIPVVASPAATYSVEATLALQQEARKIGVNLQLRRMPPDGYWANHWGKSPVSWGNVNARPSADAVFTQFFKSDARSNDAKWKNPRFDQLLNQARSEVDDEVRARIYKEMQVMIHEEGGVGIPAFISSLDGHDSRLMGLSPIPVGGLMGYEFAEHVWWDR